MAYLTGLKKQINKANQFMSEKISGVEGEHIVAALDEAAMKLLQEQSWMMISIPWSEKLISMLSWLMICK